MVYILSVIGTGLVFTAAFWFYIRQASENSSMTKAGFLLISGIAFGFTALVSTFAAVGIS